MLSGKFVRQLQKEMKIWRQQGFLPVESEEKILAYYAEKKSANPILSILAVSGALLIGLGIILLFAYNWDQFSRFQKLTLSFLPLVLAGMISAWGLVKKIKSMAFREAASVFHFLSVGAAISLVSQVYHLPGNLDGFMLIWMILVLPLLYIFSSFAAAFLYLLGVTVWAGASQADGKDALYFWMLAGCVYPFIKHNVLSHPESSRAHWLLWGTCFCLTAGLGISLEKMLPGLWMIIYGAFFTCFYLSGVLQTDDDQIGWNRPFRTFGGGGIIILSYLLTIRGFWRETGWLYYRSGYQYHALAALQDYVLLGITFSFAVLLLKRAIQQKKYFEMIFALLPIVALSLYILNSFNPAPLASTWIFNLYFLILSLACLIRGAKITDVWLLNLGMLMLGLIILTRFIDSEIGILPRAIVFLILGAGFLVTNLRLRR